MIGARQRSAWAPAAEVSLPQWIQLELGEPATIDTIHVTFQRTKDRAIDFSVETWMDGSWKAAAAVRDNKNRRCVISFQPVKTDSIRLVASRTAGQFGICEIRLYNEAQRGMKSVAQVR